MKLVMLSDTHGQHQKVKVPNGDILIHCGDFTGRDSFAELPGFLNWFQNQPHRYKLLIGGNHDWVCEKAPMLVRKLIKDFCPDIIYLENETVVIEGIRIYASPVQPPFCNWAFNIPDEKRKIYWDQIPKNTDILITHCPPYGILDKCPDGHVGDPLLADRLNKLNVRLNVFGHIHESRGTQHTDKTTYINCSVLDGQYSLVNNPIVFNFTS